MRFEDLRLPKDFYTLSRVKQEQSLTIQKLAIEKLLEQNFKNLAIVRGGNLVTKEVQYCTLPENKYS